MPAFPNKHKGQEQPTPSDLLTMDWAKALSHGWNRLKLEWAPDAAAESFPWANKWVGVACGMVSGNLEVIDFDVPEGFTEPPKFGPWCEFVQKHDPDLYDRLVVAKTMSNGRHVYYRCPEIEGNQKLAMQDLNGKAGKPFIETRGEGGFVVCPPSKGYEWLSGSPSSIPTISPDERELLLTSARMFDETPEVAAPTTESVRQRTNSTEGLRPGDDFNARTDWETLLSDDGWTVHHRQGSVTYWTRPDKSKKAGQSATTNHGGTDRLKVHTTSTVLDPVPQSYDRFGYYAAWNNLSIQDATKALAAQGYGEPSKPRNERHALLEPVINLDKPPVAGIETEEPKPSYSDLTLARSLADWQDGLNKMGDGVTTGYPSLDKYIKLEPAAINIIAGRPGHGKTTMMVNMARIMLERGEKVLYWNYEDKWERLLVWLTMSIAREHLARFASDNLQNYINFIKGKPTDLVPTDAVANARDQVVKWIETGQLVITDLPHNSQALTERIKHLAGDYRFSFIDYAQLIKSADPGLSRQVAVQAVSADIRNTVTKVDHTVIIGAQFNRDGIREGNRPKLHHLRECGDLEQDAQVVLGLFNTAMADREKEDGEPDDGYDAFDTPGATPLEVEVLKGRNGVPGKMVTLDFFGSVHRIDEQVETSKGDY